MKFLAKDSVYAIKNIKSELKKEPSGRRVFEKDYEVEDKLGFENDIYNNTVCAILTKSTAPLVLRSVVA
jgi:hypothetical protein